MSKARALLVSLLLALSPCALALNPGLDINQYAHTSWKIRDGFTKGTIYSIAQTRDGYLWLGTEYGLLRFDGVKTTPWEPPPDAGITIGPMPGLLAADDGALWIGTDPGLAIWKDGQLQRLPEFDNMRVSAMLEDRGKIWAGTFSPAIELCVIQNGNSQCHPAGQAPLDGILTLFKDRNGSLWVGSNSAVRRWEPALTAPIPDQIGVRGFAEDGDGRLLFSFAGGLARLVNRKAELAYRFPAGMESIRAESVLRDRDGGVWVASRRGLVHFYHGRVDVFGHRDGLSGDLITGLFEDREGSIWIATEGGLDRFRDYAIPAFSADQGLSSSTVLSVLAARDGSIWIGTFDGLNRFDHGQVTIYRETKGSALPGVRQIVGPGLPDRGIQAMFQDRAGRIWISDRRAIGYLQNDRFIAVDRVPGKNVQSIVEDNRGDLWIAAQDNLRHVKNDHVIDRIPWTSMGTRDIAMPMVADPVEGLWMGFGLGGIAHFADGRVRQRYAAGDGLGKGRVWRLRVASDGALWVSTDGGLSRVKDGHIATLSSKNGLPCDTVFWSIEDNAGSVWLSMPCGLARIGRSELDAWVAGKTASVPATQFDTSDGVRIAATSGSYNPRAEIAPDGRIWFGSLNGAGVIDPSRLAHNGLPPPLHIEQVIADGKIYHATHNDVKLPPLVRDLSIQFTALSLAVPEKVRFRYKLEGQDLDWKEVVNDRHAQYSNLAPRSYRFRVIASNNSGVWNGAGDVLEFSIAPAYYQTNWFRLSAVAAVFLLLWALYRFRLYQVAREFNVRLEERVSERTRVARDLHDTLLQSFHGLMLRFQVIDDLLPEGKVKEQLEQTLQRADQAIAEGRSALYDLRSSARIADDLAQAVRALGEQLATRDSTAFNLVLEGEARDLHPLIRDEVYRITLEALRNAFLHARARNVETELIYAESEFRLRVRDDGEGIPDDILKKGRPGHYGLSGMRERAREIGGKMEIWSGAGSGTEIELTVAGSIAYGTSAEGVLARLFRRKTG